MAAIFNTVEDLLLACGVPNDGILFNGDTKAERIATEVFNDDFTSCMDITFEDFESECKTYAGLTVAQGQIRLTPGTKRNIKALIQWCRDTIIIGQNPEDILFPNNDQLELIRRYKAHGVFRDKAKSISDIAKPSKFEDDTKWIDWCPTFVNFLRSIPGVTGIPLSYVIRENEAPEPVWDNNKHFLENYIAMAPLMGESFEIDSAEVHTYMMHFIAGNSVAEAKIVAHGATSSGRRDFIALKSHFEGVGINALEITKAEQIINNLFYSGEKKPHMWWSEFEKELSRAFAICQRVENRVVHSNSMKLRILISKIQADFLEQTKAALNIEMSKLPMTLTYEDALSAFRNAVNMKHPPSLSSTNNNRVRRINEVTQGRGNPGGGRMGRGRGRFSGRGGRSHGRGRGRGGQGTNYNNTKPYFINGHSKSNDTWMATTKEGKCIECHPKASYPGEIWYMIPKQDKDKIHRMRKGTDNPPPSGQSVISEVTQGTQFQLPLQSMAASVPIYNGSIPPMQPAYQVQQLATQPPAPPIPPPPPRSPVPAPTRQVSFIGGRNEQASFRSGHS